MPASIHWKGNSMMENYLSGTSWKMQDCSKQNRRISDGFFRSLLICVFTVCL